MTQLAQDKRVEASLDRLKAMGLRVNLEIISPNEIAIMIPVKDIVALINRRITYSPRESAMISDLMIIHLWKGDHPTVSLTKMIKDTNEGDLIE
ncbi:MAG: hypothetical protein ACP5L5_11400 [Vulcanisaeta sp.]|uniref:hypothetical protein n=1 Tax=Vulcanisaeta sp. TaxID=2020871 RepID=UPI003D100011